MKILDWIFSIVPQLLSLVLAGVAIYYLYLAFQNGFDWGHTAKELKYKFLIAISKGGKKYRLEVEWNTIENEWLRKKNGTV